MSGARQQDANERVAVGLLVDGDQVLLGLRAGGRPFGGLWALPGGHVEPGESPAQALVRELREELSVTVLRPQARPDAISWIGGVQRLVWILRDWDGTVSNSAPEEHERLAWFTRSELGTLAMAHAEDRDLVRRALPPLFVIVSGLPASGKSMVAREISDRLGLPWIDKDAILEALFDSLGIGDTDRRQQFSRASDEILYAIAARSHGAVLDNWWHDDSQARLHGLGGRLVQVVCDCPPQIAADRFLARERHPGHLDAELTPARRQASIETSAAHRPGPLAPGAPVIHVDTTTAIDFEHLAGQIRDHAHASQPVDAPARDRNGIRAVGLRPGGAGRGQPAAP